jgi:hypothetical protein
MQGKEVFYEVVGPKNIVREFEELKDARHCFEMRKQWSPHLVEVIQRPGGKLRTCLLSATCNDHGKVTIDEVPKLARWCPEEDDNVQKEDDEHPKVCYQVEYRGISEDYSCYEDAKKVCDGLSSVNARLLEVAYYPSGPIMCRYLDNDDQ